MRAWFNGTMTDGPIAIDPRDRGLTLGDGLFETLLVVNRAALWANMHLARLEASAHELGIVFDRAITDDAITAVLREIDGAHHALRITLIRGTGIRGLAGAGASSSLLVTCEPFDPALMFAPASLLTSTIRRNPFSPASRLKTLSYIDNIAAAREAHSRALDDALMLTADGKVASSTIANIFLVKGRKLITPARDQAILTGVMRQAVLATAHHLRFSTEERAVKPAELLKADAVFLTNSLRFVRPVTSLDQQPLAGADLSALVEQLCAAARSQCGRDPRLI